MPTSTTTTHPVWDGAATKLGSSTPALLLQRQSQKSGVWSNQKRLWTNDLSSLLLVSVQRVHTFGASNQLCIMPINQCLQDCEKIKTFTCQQHEHCFEKLSKFKLKDVSSQQKFKLHSTGCFVCAWWHVESQSFKNVFWNIILMNFILHFVFVCFFNSFELQKKKIGTWMHFLRDFSCHVSNWRKKNWSENDNWEMHFLFNITFDPLMWNVLVTSPKTCQLERNCQ